MVLVALRRPATLSALVRGEADRRIRSGDFSVRGLARRCGFSQPLAANWLAGRRGLSCRNLDAVADLLGLRLTTRAGEAVPGGPVLLRSAA